MAKTWVEGSPSDDKTCFMKGIEHPERSIELKEKSLKPTLQATTV